MGKDKIVEVDGVEFVEGPDGRDRLLWAEEVGELAHVTGHAIRKVDGRSKRHRAAGTVKPTDLPERYDTARRVVWNGHHEIPMVSPRWRQSQIEEWLAHRGPHSKVRLAETAAPGSLADVMDA